MHLYAPRLLLLPLALLICAGSVLGAGSQAPAAQPTPKVVFDLTVSLEWQPGSDDKLPDDLLLAGCEPARVAVAYLDELKAGLQETAAYLYSYSGGQFALGKITVYTGGTNWDSADIRVLANSAYRPSAIIGGIVAKPRPYVGAAPTVFYPGSILLGRLWNGLGARCGGWSQPPGWRTIGHEWGHYGLFLGDSYMHQSTAQEQYCTTSGQQLPGLISGDPAISMTDTLMAYHYRADQLWLESAPLPAGCVDTAQMRLHGTSDWQSVKAFYPTVSPPTALAAGPTFAGSPAEASFALTVIQPALVPSDASAAVRLASLATPKLTGLAYLLRPDPNGGVERIIGQGEIIPGEAATLPFWGVQPATKDRAVVVLPNWISGERRAFPADYRTAPVLDLAATNLLSATVSTWQPSMEITPQVIEIRGISEVSGLRVRVEDCARRTKVLELAYCPAGGACDQQTRVVDGDGDGVFEHTFFFPLDGSYEPPAAHGYIYGRNSATFEETVGWYQLGGGVGPAIGDGHAPLADSLVDLSVAKGQPTPAADTGLLFSPAQRCQVPAGSLPTGVLGIVGTPLNIQPVVANGNGGRGWGSDPADGPLLVRLAYSQDLLDRLEIGEGQLVMLQLDPRKRSWLAVPSAGQSNALDWIAANARTFGGQGEDYAIGYVAAPEPVPERVWLPLIIK